MRPFYQVDDYLHVLEVYNNNIWPIQAYAYALGGIALLLVFRKERSSSRIISGLLGLSWIWVGLVFHINYLALVSEMAYFFGAVFVLQGGLILWHGLISRYFGSLRPRLAFQFSFNIFSILGVFYILSSMLFYPLAYYSYEYTYPGIPVFGVSPSPVAVFCLGMFLTSVRRVPPYLLIIPVAWFVISFSIFMHLAVRLDILFFIANLAGALLVILNNRHKDRLSVKVERSFST